MVFIFFFSDADLSISHLTVVNRVDGGLHLEWDMNNIQFGNCSLRYRVTVSGDNDDVITDAYVDERQLDLSTLSSCVNYEFNVRVVNLAPPTMEGPLRSMEYEFPEKSKPSVKSYKFYNDC